MGFWPIGLGLSSTESTVLISSSSDTQENEQNKGIISLDNTDLNLIEPESLRKHIALMSQQGHIFDASIKDNLLLAKHDATETEIREVCQLVNLTEFIDTLPNGFNTWLGSTGIGLSGGQAQRLQIAQLLLRPADVLVLDEPTKGLDRRNEAQIMSNILDHVKRKKQSLLVITHKPLMLEQMDKIVVMEKGKIVSQGTHQTLFNQNNYYQKLLNYF
jgi:ATP-binding cassette subfamily C protein CydC